MPHKDNADRIPNQLIHEKSPYLLQHAYNPVDWHPWGEEAFQKAKRENKTVFLSIGYSTCHWCHVMAHESFEDVEVAKLLNDAFVCIKVDREERPDIDGVYMNACQLTTGSGGWPLTVLLTPEKKPFFAGTYFPKKSRANHIGMLDLIPRLKSVWGNRSNEVLQSAQEITEALQKMTHPAGDGLLDEPILKKAQLELMARFDKAYGGFGTRPKFPTPHQLTFLLRQWRRNGDEQTLHIVEKTLQAMRLGGIYDHVGFGFHRYATDARWLVPHFEKMLYDQAMLAMAYTEAFQATGKPEYRQTAEEILEYALRDMTAPEGGFYSAEDADSEGEEGKFYVWSQAELRNVLDSDEAELLIQAFNVTAEGNFFEEASGQKTGTNILHLKKPLSELAAEFEAEDSDFSTRISHACQRLFEARKQRVHPFKDDKILSDWNGLMVAALAKAAQAFDEPRYVKAAQKATAFIQKELICSKGRLFHRFREGEAAISGYLNDYAFFIWGLLELYEATFMANYLQTAVDLNEMLVAHFWDEANGGFFFTSDESESLPMRQKEIYDGAIPSGNSVAMQNMLRLGQMMGNSELTEKAERIGQLCSEQVQQSPSAFTQLLNAVDFALGPCYEVVFAGDLHAQDTRAMLNALRSCFIPNKVVLFRRTHQHNDPIMLLAPFTEHHVSIEEKTTAYVCVNYHCNQPTTEVTTLLNLLKA